MRPEARDLFLEMARDCGPSIFRMQASCEMYLAQYLPDFPDERGVLAAALRRGVPDAVLQFEEATGYDDHLAVLGQKLATSAELDPDAARWAVEAWAAALGRPAGGYVPPKPVRVGDGRFYPDDDPDSPTLRAVASTAMTAIVGGSAFAGGLIATMLIPILMWAVDLSSVFLQDLHARAGGKGAAQADELLLFLIFLALGFGVGLLGAGAAVGAWLFAGGNERPWATGSVAFGTAFVMVFIAGFVPFIVLPAKPIVFFCSVFGAAYKSAARGGEY
jgi:hypothetical protein